MTVSILNDEYGDIVPFRPKNISVEEAAYISSHGIMRKLQKVDVVDNSEGLLFLHLICSLISITVKVDYFLLLRKDVFHVL
jgi:hypothetical protein